MAEILEARSSDGRPILLTTHYMEEADRLCERLAIMDHGHLLALDRPDALKRTVGPDTILMVRTDGDAEALVDVVRGIEGVRPRERRGGRGHDRDPRSTACSPG